MEQNFAIKERATAIKSRRDPGPTLVLAPLPLSQMAAPVVYPAEPASGSFYSDLLPPPDTGILTILHLRQ